MKQNMIRSKVLGDLIAKMDSVDVDKLKKHSPKFAKVDIQSNDEDLAESLKDKLLSDESEPSQEFSDEQKFPMLENSEDDEDLACMMELRNKLK